MKKEIIKTSTLFRHMQFSRDTANADDRTVDLAFSSEEPYERWFGTEVLDHGPGSCDLTRLNSGGALLDNHDPDEQIGVVVPGSARIDPDRVGRATVKFSRSPQGQIMMQDVMDGIVTNVSVGYQINSMVEVTTTDADGDEDTVCRVMSWTPLEISLVAIPADPTVGVGRSAGAEEHETVVERPEQPAKPEPEAPEVAPEAPAETPTQPEPERKITMETVVDKDKSRQEGVQAEQKRSGDLLALAETYEKYGAREMVVDFIRTGKSPEQFQAAIMEKIVARHSTASDMEIGLTNSEVQAYSLIRAIQASITGDWSKAGFERSVSEAVGKRMGRTPEGFFIPVEAFSRKAMAPLKRDFQAAAGGGADNLIQSSILPTEFVDVLRNALAFSKLGVRVLGGLTSNVLIPRKTTAMTAQNLTEIAALTASAPGTNQLSLTPHRIGGQILYSKQALIQSSMDIEAMLRDDLMQTLARLLENLGINGTGAAPQPTGLLNVSGIGSVVGGANGAQIAWSHLVNLESACANLNAEPDQNAGYLVNTKERGWMKQTQRATYLPYIWDPNDKDFPMNGYKAVVSNTVPSNLTKGTSVGVCSAMIYGSDWTDFIVALFGGLDVVVDPLTKAGTGEVVITGNQFVDFGVRHTASFAAMTDALTA